MDRIQCEIFCRVIDNYGDAGVCWRLARQLALEHGWHVVLWIDDMQPLRQLAPDFLSGPVDVRPWPAQDTVFPASRIVIEAFACELPEQRVAHLAAQARQPVWINLEYLSAEDWVAGCHGLDSRHPRLPLVKQFFFPGFDAKTGGLLRERDYAQRRSRFDTDRFRTEFGLPPRLPDELTVSLFSYPNPAFPALKAAWSAGDRPVRLLLPGGTETRSTQGSLETIPLPFLPQSRYDELLWSCDLNFVRGEDSFVRAQWAAKPFVWHIYPQAGDAHMKKLGAFLDRFGADPAMRHFWQAWNGTGQIDWPAFAMGLAERKLRAERWAQTLLGHPDLAENLVQFCQKRLIPG